MTRARARKIGRNTKSGKWVSVRETKRRFGTTKREYIPLPGDGQKHRTKNDAVRAARETLKYRDANSGRLVPLRDRHPSKSSADRIRDTSEKASDSLKRLAKR